MDKCSLIFFIFRVIFVLSYAESQPSQTKACSKLIKNDEKYECVANSDCSTLNQLIRDGKVVVCGNVAGITKICCPKNSGRVTRQVRIVPKKDPYFIAKQKCTEYSDARYVERVIPPEIPDRPPTIRRKLDCVKAQPLIFGGVAAILKEFPHMALIGYNDRSDQPEDAHWACGGTLISDRFVLTAAHCLKAGNSAAKWVRLGELVVNQNDDSAQPKDFRIVERIPHPLYNSASVYHDIMLLELPSPIKFTPHMRPICLYTSPVLAPALNNKAVITGWGVTATGEQNSEPLLKAQISFAHDKECATSYREDKKLAKGYDPVTMICAGDKLQGRDTCAGDSGGPLQVPVPDWTCMYAQVGITSYGGFICGQKNVSAIYTKIAPYIPWIQSIVWP